MTTRQVEVWPIERLTKYESNARQHSPEQVAALARSIRQFGFTSPVLIAGDGEIIAGHGRVMAAVHAGLTEAPVIVLDDLSEADRKAYRIADNKLGELSSWDMGVLESELNALRMDAYDFGSMGFDSEALTDLLAPMEEPHEPLTHATSKERGSMADDFLYPPFGLFRVSSGDWQKRKKLWLDRLVLSYENLGREGDLLMRTPTRFDPHFYDKKNKTEQVLGRNLSYSEFIETYYVRPEGRTHTGTSMFDPVLCELITIWYSPPGGMIIDPFAGDVERGLVASAKGRRYIGIDVRTEQCAANNAAAAVTGWKPSPTWKQGNSRTDAGKCWRNVRADLAFTCPPYWNLEKYSDDPDDLSNMSLEDFNAAHGEIIEATLGKLKDNRFAVWVINDVKQPGGRWAHIVADTVAAFERAGAYLHNHAMLETPVASRRVGARPAFVGRRTLVSVTESVLVFCKGDPGKAAAELGTVVVGDMPDVDDDAV